MPDQPCFLSNRFVTKYAELPRFLLGVDYELFFGDRVGTPLHCLIEPTNALVAVLERYGAYLTLFVDVGYLIRLEQQSRTSPALAKDLRAVEQHLHSLARRGHDLQLHIHPHWEDCLYANGGWEMNLQRYRLQQFASDEINDIVTTYAEKLRSVANSSVHCFRAGGWCIQPFEPLQEAFRNANIHVDSSVFAGGLSQDPSNGFDYRDAPNRMNWRFSTDPLCPDKRGEMTELAISSTKVAPSHFWLARAAGKIQKGLHRQFGDGSPVDHGTRYYFQRLTTPTVIPLSVDGYKANRLRAAWQEAVAGSVDTLNVMGHPKALSRFSLRCLEQFLTDCPMEHHTFESYRQEYLAQ